MLYWEEYKRLKHELRSTDAKTDEKAIQEKLLSRPNYKVKEREKRKYTEEIETRLKEILKEEKRKDTLFGQGHKQNLTKKNIKQSRV
ncbi:MAG: hypothetical protein FWC89_11010 [Defluviitaleaceae bacterium]|nr:hypothetical protein [Defluviitaleaceae bacterium]